MDHGPVFLSLGGRWWGLGEALCLGAHLSGVGVVGAHFLPGVPEPLWWGPFSAKGCSEEAQNWRQKWDFRRSTHTCPVVQGLSPGF